MVAHGGQDEGRSFDLDGSGATPLTSEDPRRIGPFPVIGLLGVGGMGRVYLAVAEDRYTAVKRVHPVLAQDPDFLRHFKHELDNLARLPAGVSVPLLATDRTANPPWFATEYIPGVTLTEAVHLHGGPLPRAALWYLLRELAARLKALHALDMLHRDVKPSNVMLTLDGLALIDFGIARAADQSRLTKTGMVLGTPEYMAPEQAEAVRPLTAAADVFALGSLLFFAATGASPFGPGSGLEVLYRIVHTEPDLSALRGLDRELADLVAACLDKSPAARPTAADLLDRVAEGAAPAAADWPTAVAEQLERRAAFAAAVPALDELTSATVDLKPAPPAAPAAAIAGAAATGQEGTSAEPPPAGPPEAGGDPEKRVRPPETPKRRSRKLVLIIPIVLAAGGVSAVTLLPYAFSHTDGKPSAAPSSGPSVSPSADRGGPSSSARPGHSTSASASTSGHSSGAGAKSGATSGAGSKKSGTGSAGGTGGSHSGGSGTSGGSGGTSGGGSSSSGGSSSGGSSGGKRRERGHDEDRLRRDLPHQERVQRPLPGAGHQHRQRKHVRADRYLLPGEQPLLRVDLQARFERHVRGDQQGQRLLPHRLPVGQLGERGAVRFDRPVLADRQREVRRQHPGEHQLLAVHESGHRGEGDRLQRLVLLAALELRQQGLTRQRPQGADPRTAAPSPQEAPPHQMSRKP